MKLHIQFFDGKDENAKLLANMELPVPEFSDDRRGRGGKVKVCGKIPWGGEDTAFIEARLEDIPTGEKVKGKYQLKLAYRPDYDPWTDRDGAFFKEENGEPCFRMQLLRGADGQSLLRLIHRASMAVDSLKTDVAVWSIDVKPREEKTTAFHLMVDEMLCVNPFGVLSEFQGLSKTNVSKKFERAHTASDLWHINTQIEVCEELMDLMRPHLLALACRHADVMTRTLKRIGLPKSGRRVYAITLRDIKLRNAFKSQAKVFTPVLMLSNDIPIHEAIAVFLDSLRFDLSSLHKKISLRMQDDRELLRTARDGYKAKDLREEIEYKDELLMRVKKVCDDCSSFLTSSFPWFRCCRRRVRRRVTTISINDVPNVESYRALYFLMLRYSKMRNFKGALEGRFYVPQYVRIQADEMSSTWQRNYSFVYEVWVFKRLVDAFSAEGFSGLREKYKRQIACRMKDIILGTVENDPLCASNEDGIEVKLYFGLRAYNDAKLNDEGFSIKKGENSSPEEKERELLTPDFAIVFSQVQNPTEKYWMVLDAKSCDVLKERDVKKRDLYYKQLKLDRQKPQQSWLIYSGRLKSSKRVSCVAGLESNAEEVGHDSGVSWDEELRTTNPLSENAEASFSGAGWFGYNKLPMDLRGHLRANVKTDVVTRSVFREFARGQIATAKSWFAHQSQ